MSFNDQVRTAFQARYGRFPAVITKAPGTVTLLGSPTAQGSVPVLSAAITRGVWAAAAPTNTPVVTVFALNYQEDGRFQLPYLNVHASSVASSWINYPVGAAWALQEGGHELVGMDMMLFGDLPPGVGLGSSAALTLAVESAWEALSGFELNAAARVQIGKQTEEAYLGQAFNPIPYLTAVYAQKNKLLHIDHTHLSVEPVALPPNLVLLIVDSGHRPRMAEPRPDVAVAAVAALRRHLPQIQTLNDLSQDVFELHGHHLPEPLRQQAQHLVDEAARVQDGVTALQKDEMSAFARLMRQSHISIRDLWGGSISEVDVLAAAAWSVPGCYGARLLGDRGVLAVLAEETAVPDLQQTMTETFVAEYDRVPPIMITQIDRRLEISRFDEGKGEQTEIALE